MKKIVPRVICTVLVLLASVLVIKILPAWPGECYCPSCGEVAETEVETCSSCGNRVVAAEHNNAWIPITTVFVLIILLAVWSI